MIAIFIFYGLAFFVMGIVIFTMPRRNYVGLFPRAFWLLGLFAITHGINEWVELLISLGTYLDLSVLRVIGIVLLYVSFTFLFIFSARCLSYHSPRFKALELAWIFFLPMGILAYITTGDFIVTEIVARYFICFPAAMLTAASMANIIRIHRAKLSRPIFILMLALIIFSAIYGILAGLVTPRADFLFAKFLNYDTFKDIMKFPVQFFRMCCAIVIACSLFAMNRLLALRNKELGSIRRKITLFIFLANLVVVIFGLILGYIVGYYLLTEIIGNRGKDVAYTFARTIELNLIKEIQAVEIHATRPLWIDVVKQKNAKYLGRQAKDIERQNLEIDTIWTKAEADSYLEKEYLENRASLSMREIVAIKNEIAEIFITDKSGALVAASDKTSDFYQADEEWWQKAYNNGYGALYIGDVGYDISSGRWAISIAVPMRDPETKEIIGICKESFSVEQLFSKIIAFRFGSDSKIFIVDSSGRILFGLGVIPLENKIAEDVIVRKIFNSHNSFETVRLNKPIAEKVFITSAKINILEFVKRGIVWRVVTAQPVASALRSLNLLTLYFFMFAGLLVAIMLPLGYFFGTLLSKPIRQLHMLANKINIGIWDFSVNIKTNDEIEDFAKTFQAMLKSLKEKQDELILAKNSLELSSQDLEFKVEERTKELNRVQEATLNILEDLVEAKEKLEAAILVKSDFMSMVSHELRTPLTAIKEGITIVLDETAGNLNPSQKEFLSIAERNVDRLSRLINEVLDFQKIQARKMVFHFLENDLNAVIREVALGMRPVAKDKGLDFNLLLDDSLPKIIFDRDKITQVMSNLIDNAIKFTPSGTVSVSTRREGNVAIVSVKDTGIGVKKEDMEKLFHKFEQLANSMERKTGGTGLGLAISKEIMQEHKGKIWIESECGTGSTFSFLLPIVDRRA